MTPHNRSAANQRSDNVARAFKRLKSNPEFASVVIQIHERVTEAKRNISVEAQSFQTPARQEHVVSLFEIWAEAYLRLVTNQHSHDDYLVILRDYARLAWQEYTGHPARLFEFAAVSPIQEPISARFEHWAIEGYKRLESLRTGQGSTIQTHGDSIAELRKAYVLPRLQEKGISRSKWASLAGVDPSVVYDYLAGESEPRADNRRALAEVLGLKGSDLPS